MNQQEINLSNTAPLEALCCANPTTEVMPDNGAEAVHCPTEALVVQDCGHEEGCADDDRDNTCCVSDKRRTLNEMYENMKILRKQIWYNGCYMNLRESIKEGEIKIVNNAEWHAIRYPENLNYVTDEVWAGAKRTAQKIEEEIGAENLVVIDEIDMAMLEGKLVALRYACGDEEWKHLYA